MTDQDQTPAVFPPETPHAVTSGRRGRSQILDTALFFRSRRRALVRQIEATTGRTLLCYVSLGPSIARSDTYDLIRILQRVDSGASISLLLDSAGGEIDSAEKMVHLLREACKPSTDTGGGLEVVIPYRAKSAATLIALGADRIVMSDSSELGPIDPLLDSVPAIPFLRAYEKAEERCVRHPNNDAFIQEYSKFSPVVVEMMRLAVSRSRKCAEHLLKQKGGNYTAIPELLVDVERFPSHGQMIDWRTAQQMKIPGVCPLDRQNQLWRQYWHLYEQLTAVCGEGRRVFESRDLTIVSR